MERFFKDLEYKEYVSKFEDTLYLWKLDNKEWTQKRKQVWDSILEREKIDASDFNKKYWAERERFFLRAKPQLNDKEIFLAERIVLTPFTSPEQIIESFKTVHKSLQGRTQEEILRLANRYYRSVPDEFHQVELIVEALFGKERVGLTYERRSRPRFRSQSPFDFTIHFVFEASFYMKLSSNDFLDNLKANSNRHYNGKERSFVELTFDYLISSVEYALSAFDKPQGGNLREDFWPEFKALSDMVINYSPDIDSAYRDAFVADFKEKILSNENYMKLMGYDS